MSAAKLVALQPTEFYRRGMYRPDDAGYIKFKSSLPFYRSNGGAYTHRVRSGGMLTSGWKPAHSVLHLWCGATGFPGTKGKLLAEPGPVDIICATCEGRAIGAGQTGTPTIAGRVVRFSPRV